MKIRRLLFSFASSLLLLTSCDVSLNATTSKSEPVVSTPIVSTPTIPQQTTEETSTQPVINTSTTVTTPSNTEVTPTTPVTVTTPGMTTLPATTIIPTVLPTTSLTTKPIISTTVTTSVTTPVISTSIVPTTTVVTTPPGPVVTTPTITSDPYVNVSESSFYANYTEASCYMDAYYRTKHNLMSGSIEDEDRYYLPKENQLGNYIVSDMNYTVNKTGDYEAFTINYTNGEKMDIYYGGAYVSLNEVCAYIYAFGEVPPNSNYASSKSGKKSSVADWGEYGRCNIGKYSNDTSKYKYEPELPTKSSLTNKAYTYTETDFGSTGGFYVNGTKQSEYNNGSSITRGTCRIVFTNNATSAADRHVFYTYNHYNDFQEYLNYYDGFGIRFGNESNGGKYNSGSNPSPYVAATNITLEELKKLLNAK